MKARPSRLFAAAGACFLSRRGFCAPGFKGRKRFLPAAAVDFWENIIYNFFVFFAAVCLHGKGAKRKSNIDPYTIRFEKLYAE